MTRLQEILAGINCSEATRRGVLRALERQRRATAVAPTVSPPAPTVPPAAPTAEAAPVAEAEIVAQAPGLARKAKNYVKAVVRHIADGREKLSDEQTEARLAVCRGCEFLDAEGRCRDKECGCPVTKKAAWRSEPCPRNKWPKLPAAGDHST